MLYMDHRQGTTSLSALNWMSTNSKSRTNRTTGSRVSSRPGSPVWLSAPMAPSAYFLSYHDKLLHCLIHLSFLTDKLLHCLIHLSFLTDKLHHCLIHLSFLSDMLYTNLLYISPFYWHAASLSDTSILSYWQAALLSDTSILSYWQAISLSDTSILSYW